METNIEYSTSDIYITAFLKANGLVLRGVQLDDKQIARFEFESVDKVKLEVLLKDYRNNSLVGVQDLLNALKSLKGFLRKR